MIICKTPIAKFIETLINTISLGKFEQLKEKLGFDEMFHVWLLLEMDSGEIFYAEKNQTLNIGNASENRKYYFDPKRMMKVSTVGDTTIKNISEFRTKKREGKIEETLRKKYEPLTLYEALEKTKNIMGVDKYFDYDGKNNNCQLFLINFLKANDQLNDQEYKFIYQDTEFIFSQVPEFISTFNKGITDIAGIFDFITKK